LLSGKRASTTQSSKFPRSPLRRALGSYPVLQLRRGRRLVAVDVLDEARAPHVMCVRAQPGVSAAA
jgi:hypothetical protein